MTGRRRYRRSLLRLLVVLPLVLLAGFPLYWMVATATRAPDEIFADPPKLLPNLARLPHILTDATRDVPMLRWLLNSAFVAVGTTLLSLVLAVFAAYALSRFDFRGKGVFGFALFATQMLPEALLVVPLYALFLTFGLLNNLWGLVLATPPSPCPSRCGS